MMDIDNRNHFLNNLARNLDRPRRMESVERPKWSLRPQLELYKDYTHDELVDVLEGQCKVIHTNFKRTTFTELSTVLTETIQGHDGKRIIASNDPRNNEYGMDEIYAKWREDKIDVRLWDETTGKENQEFAEKADIGITFSEVTLAESGTVTLFNDKNNGRTISLLPRVHVVIIPKSTIVPRMTQAVKQIHEANQGGNDVASCVSFISGPSNSADIEMNLIVGVHGPVEATYIVVEDK
ncbi:lactate utilization protein C [Sporosarcina pasteurii]|uniref:Lactate utilization protein C n=1 Tax=Sporosarcina pasteurii TaxID=1474 RepID=A0A380BCA6_SPOPA|nr:lactate utilization protein C [Sporosarcina pasteurii]MDS9472918.1 lactate utilization protein C [Sporosarcina pasteurii]SUI98424.1 Lactate utilization protein C [Sporosarcina pasteurii]